jgi:4,5-DOPA dioxygenase extradiol
MPVVFVGHGSPMNVLEKNRFSAGFAELRSLVPKPRAILAVSAHWYVRGAYLTSAPRPKTIHDFSGFPKALYEIEYRSPGSVDLATRTQALLTRSGAELRDDWGLDHGTWSVLRWMFPEADVPVVQLSIDRRLDPRGHLELAKSLSALRDDGVLILGSGNVTHNLGDAIGRMQSGDVSTPAWATCFDEATKRALLDRDERAMAALRDTNDGPVAHPSPDHLLPLLYTFAATTKDDPVRFTSEAFDLGSISMRNVIWG